MKWHSGLPLAGLILIAAVIGVYDFVSLPYCSYGREKACAPQPRAADHLCNEGWHCGPYEGK